MPTKDKRPEPGRRAVSLTASAPRPPRDLAREGRAATALGTGAYLRRVREQWAEDDRRR